jgi:3-oxoadipate enol-lactonase
MWLRNNRPNGDGMHIKANSINIHYRIEGREGAPWLTFITGIANDVTMWDDQVPVLQENFRILRYDLRGHGQSEATSGNYSFPLLTGDLLSLWDALGIKRSSLVGLGLGGAITIGVGINHPDRLDRLVPCCCRAIMTPDFAAIWPKFVATVKQYDMEGMVEPTVQRWFTDDFKAANPQKLDNVRRMIRGTNPLGYYGCIAAFLTLDYCAGLRRISVPTLFVSGADDRVGGPPEIMADLATAVPSAHHVSVPHAAHIANIQNPDSFNAILAKFLRG